MSQNAKKENKKKQQLKGKHRLNSAAASHDIFFNPIFHKVILFFSAWLLYGWTAHFGYAIDDKFITQPLSGFDNNINGIIELFKTWFAGADYRPMSFLSFWLERKITGEITPEFSHIVNVFLFSIILVKIYDFIVVAKFYPEENKLKLLAALTALFFLIHPNHVSVVANIKARDNLLSLLFGITACIQMIKFLDGKKIYHLVFFILLMLAALLSKWDAYIFLLTPWLVYFIFRQPSFTIKNMIKPAVVGLGSFLFIILVLSLFQSGLNREEYIFSMGFDENPLIGHDTFLHRLSMLFTSLFYYFKFLFIPNGYYFFFGYNQIALSNLFSATNIVAILLLIIFGILSFLFYKKNRIYLFALLFFLLAITYALNFFVIVAGVVMDKYNFIPSIGFCIALSAIIIDMPKKYLYGVGGYLLTIFLGSVYIYFTVTRTMDWQNSFTLIEKDMPFLKQSANANRMAGGAYINLALAEELNPNHQEEYTDNLIHIGEQYAIQGLKVYDKVPDLWELRGLSSFYRKDYSTALQYFIKSMQVDSSYLSSINYIGYTYWALGNTDSAAFYFKYVINREPAFGYAANNYIDMLMRQNKKQEADSLIIVLKNRFPKDKWLNQKMMQLNR